MLFKKLIHSIRAAYWYFTTKYISHNQNVLYQSQIFFQNLQIFTMPVIVTITTLKYTFKCIFECDLYWIWSFEFFTSSSPKIWCYFFIFFGSKLAVNIHYMLIKKKLIKPFIRILFSKLFLSSVLNISFKYFELMFSQKSKKVNSV